MSVPFTVPTEYNFLSTSVLNELITAYNEWDQAAFYGTHQMVPLVKGQNLQDYQNDDLDPQFGGFWRMLQEGLLDQEYPPLNYILGPLTPDKKNFLPFTWPQFFSAAGLPPYGPRHARDGSIHNPTWLTDPRYALPGDMLGPWIVEDLQNLYSAARWTLRTGDSDIESIMQIPPRENPYFPDWDWYSQMIGDYAAFASSRLTGFDASMASWGGGHTWGADNGHTLNGYNADPPLLYLATSGYSYGWRGDGVGDRASYGKVDRARRRGKARLAGLPPIPHVAEVYLQLTSADGEFDDLDELGWNEGEFNLAESFAESDATVREQSNYIGDYTSDPAVLADLTVDMNEQFDDPGYSGGAATRGCMIVDSKWLMKWNFTYRNV